MSGWQIDPDSHHKTPPAAQKRGKGRKVPSKQQLILKGEEAAYSTLRAVYLEENQKCTRPGCIKDATQIHHVVSGTAGKARSRLNQDTWLGVCSDECHNAIAGLPPELQIIIKQHSVARTIERLRR